MDHDLLQDVAHLSRLVRALPRSARLPAMANAVVARLAALPPAAFPAVDDRMRSAGQLCLRDPPATAPGPAAPERSMSPRSAALGFR